MAQANTNNTTSMPVDQTRRRFLSQAAGGAVLAPASPPASAMDDPIFAAIDAFRRSDASCVAVHGDIPDDLMDLRHAAYSVVLRTRPNTPAGLAALTTWAREQANWLRANASVLHGKDLCALTVSIDDATRGMSGLKPWSPPLPAVASHSGPDPILAAIEAHKAARATWIEWVHRHSDLDRELPHDKCRSSVTAWEEKIVGTDDPRWIEAEREIGRTSDLETDAACVLVSIVPTTQAGVVALLQYALLADTDGEGWPRDLLSDDGTKRRSWHYFLIENVTEALTDLVTS